MKFFPAFIAGWASLVHEDYFTMEDCYDRKN